MFGRFGRKLRAVREERGWSLTDLWLASGMSPSELSRLERGGRDVRLTTLIALDDALGVAPAERRSATRVTLGA
jgi:transcriptional regulator with XRE-family HTH domain